MDAVSGTRLMGRYCLADAALIHILSMVQGLFRAKLSYRGAGLRKARLLPRRSIRSATTPESSGLHGMPEPGPA